MNTNSESSLRQGLRPGGAIREVRFCEEEEVEGRISRQDGSPKLKCWTCTTVFPVRSPLREEIYYVCPHCKGLNQPGPVTFDLPLVPVPPKGAFKAPVLLDSVFLQGSDGSLFELPFDEAGRYQLTDERAAELGHPPFPGPSDRVEGHHMVAGGSAADPASWAYHQSWQFGCYYDEVQGGFCTGMHRHPYGDERAVPAAPSDFA